MSMRTRILGMVDVIMRVPPLFVIDEILKISMGLPSFSSGGIASYNSSSGSDNASGAVFAGSGLPDILASNHSQQQPQFGGNYTHDEHPALADAMTLANVTKAAGGSIDASDYFRVLSLTTLKFFACLLGWMCAACVFMLWTRHLVIVYMYVLSVGLIFLSYWCNVSAVTILAAAPGGSGSILEDILSLNTTSLFDANGAAVAVFPHLVAQWMIGLSFSYVHLGPRYTLVQRALPINFLAPVLLAMLPLPPQLIRHSPAFAAVMPLALCKVVMWSSSFDVLKTVFNGYAHARTFATNFGLSALVENEWQRLNVPSVLRAFWVIRLSEQLLTSVAFAEEAIPVLTAAQNLLVSGCETLTAILGMTSIVSVICHYIGKMFQLFLMSDDYDEDKSIGTVSAILFYILALQTGLTTLVPEKRFVRLCRNFCLLVSALLHFLHNIVAPILMSLSAARNPSMKRHARALTVCVFLLVAPLALLAVLWTKHSPSTWLLAVTAFSVEVIIKVLVSLATYALFLMDARRQSFWEKLDDYVYYIRAFGNSVEFCFGIFLFFNGAWILAFESGGAIRAVMMGVHAYFNIWCEARAGWAVFMKRRTAVHKISALPEASEKQLADFDDVCAICYQKMSTAKITRCRHYFHGVCLRKWLYVQDRCPLCHEIIMHTEPPADAKPAAVQVAAAMRHVDALLLPPPVAAPAGAAQQGDAVAAQLPAVAAPAPQLDANEADAPRDAGNLPQNAGAGAIHGRRSVHQLRRGDSIGSVGSSSASSSSDASTATTAPLLRRPSSESTESSDQRRLEELE